MSSYGHSIERHGLHDFTLYWTVDNKIQGSRLRFPSARSRDSDRAGAVRFAKRWNVHYDFLGGDNEYQK